MLYDREEPVVVYFHPASGDTHLVSDFAGDVLRQLAVSDLSIEDLVAYYQETLTESSSEADRTTLIQDTLHQLVAVDLVESY